MNKKIINKKRLRSIKDIRKFSGHVFSLSLLLLLFVILILWCVDYVKQRSLGDNKFPRGTKVAETMTVITYNNQDALKDTTTQIIYYNYPAISNPVKYLVNSFTVVKSNKKDNTLQNKQDLKQKYYNENLQEKKSEDVHPIKAETENSTEEINPNTKSTVDNNANKYQDILNDTGNIVNHTSNLLTYVTIFITIMGALGGICIYKYLITVRRLEQETENLQNKTLDAGLVTISAIPMVEATQITSDEYDSAIETITDAIMENRDAIEDNPKYTKLFIVEALYYWNSGDYKHIVKILEEALELSYKKRNDATRETIYYHLARVYKQWGYEENNEQYLKKANEYALDTFPVQGRVINLSTASILYNKNSTVEQKINLLKKLRNCIGEENHQFSLEDGITDFASWTAFTIIALIGEKILCKNDIKDNITVNNVVKKYAEESLKVFQNNIYSKSGANVKMSWYRTMMQLAIKTSDIELANDYKCLSELNLEAVKPINQNNKELRIFHPYLLVEEEKESKEIINEMNNMIKRAESGA